MASEYQCRICLDDDLKENLCSPCKCKGSQKYVHERCLNTFREQFYNFHVHRLYCSVCKTEYTIPCESFELSIDTDMDMFEDDAFPPSPNRLRYTKTKFIHQLPSFVFAGNTILCMVLYEWTIDKHLMFNAQFMQGVLQSFQYAYFAKDCFFLWVSISLLVFMIAYVPYLLLPVNLCLCIGVLCKMREFC